jgi:ssDNA-binding Zn-finger/Zn-ribbon topoisomerase 1
MTNKAKLGPCPACGKRTGQLRELAGGRFRHYVDCTECPFMTEPARAAGIAVKLWNEAKVRKGKPG